VVVSLNAPDVGFRVGFMSFSLPHSSIRLRLLMARPRARVGDGQRLQRSEGCPLPAKSRVARRMAAYGGTVHSRSALGKNRHRQDMAVPGPWGAAPNPALAVGQPGRVKNQPTPAAGSVGSRRSVKGFRGINRLPPASGPLLFIPRSLDSPSLISVPWSAISATSHSDERRWLGL